MPSDIAFYVLHAPGRPDVNQRCFESIRASDVGEDFTLCTNPPGVKPLDHWTDTFRRMSDSPAPAVVLLEDDCIVNRHILWNLRTWKWPHERQFGAGWLFNPGGWNADGDAWYTGGHEWYGTVGVLYWKSDLPALLDAALKWLHEHKSISWDCAIAFAVHWIGKKIRVHGPPLVEHQWANARDTPSLLGHKHSWSYSTTRNGFKPDWRRPEPREPVKVYTGRSP